MLSRIVILFFTLLCLHTYAENIDHAFIEKFDFTPVIKQQKVSFIPGETSLFKQQKQLLTSSGESSSNASWGNVFAGEIRNNFNSNNQLNVDHSFTNVMGGSTTYQLGRFSAETGIIDHEIDAKQYFLQGAYLVVNKEKFNLSVLAKVESFENYYVKYYYHTNALDIIIPDNEPAMNMTVGFTGHYSLTPQWAIIGSVTSSQNQFEQADVFTETTNHSALIGTSYSF